MVSVRADASRACLRAVMTEWTLQRAIVVARSAGLLAIKLRISAIEVTEIPVFNTWTLRG